MKKLVDFKKKCDTVVHMKTKQSKSRKEVIHEYIYTPGKPVVHRIIRK